MRTIVNKIAVKALATFFSGEKPTLLLGDKAQTKLVQLMIENHHQRPLIVADGFLNQTGKLDPILSLFEQNGIQTSVFDDVKPNPTLDLVEQCVEQAKLNQCDSVLVIGGGSAIDIAKVVAASITNGFNPKSLAGIVKVKQPAAALYAIPTTSGTGSEATTAAVISDPDTHKKLFFVDPKYVPVMAALDPELIATLPPAITAATGMDALTHAIEAYTSTAKFPDAKRDALSAIRLLVKYLPQAYNNGEGLNAREQVALGSFLAGFAFSKSGLGFVHAISHQISAHYNTPHGLANAVILPQVLRFNAAVCAEEYAEIELALTSGEGNSAKADLVEHFISRIDQLANELAIPAVLPDIQKRDFNAIADAAIKEAKSSYAVPKFMTMKDVHQVLYAISNAKP